MNGKRMQLHYATLAVTAIAILAGSINTRAEDAKVEEPKKNPWEQSISLGLSVTDGNSDTLLFVGAYDAKRVWEHDEFRGMVTGSYGETDSNTTTEAAEGLAQYKHLFSERLYGTAYIDLFHDGVADITYRLTLSPGVGYYFIKSDKTQLSGDIGPSYVVEKLEGQGTDSYAGLRLAERFDRKLNDSAKVWQSLEWVPQIDDFGNYVLVFEVGVEAALNKTLSVRVVGIDRYDNQPAPGRENNDMSLISSLSYKF
jgi:putative salt-induced outer membrane protein YdiY